MTISRFWAAGGFTGIGHPSADARDHIDVVRQDLSVFRVLERRSHRNRKGPPHPQANHGAAKLSSHSRPRPREHKRNI